MKRHVSPNNKFHNYFGALQKIKAFHFCDRGKRLQLLRQKAIMAKNIQQWLYLGYESAKWNVGTWHSQKSYTVKFVCGTWWLEKSFWPFCTCERATERVNLSPPPVVVSLVSIPILIYLTNCMIHQKMS